MDTLDVTRQLTKAELEDLEEEQRLIRLYEMRTSVEPRYTLQEQADELGVSVSTIKRMARSDKFQQVASQLAPKTRSIMAQVGMDYVTESLLPLALQKAKELLENPATPEHVKANLFNTICRYALVDKSSAGSDTARQDAMTFLKQQGLSIGSINVVVNNVGLAPPEYLEGLKAILPETVEGELVQ
jgi:hypothetical protein